MASIQKFEDLESWKLARQLCKRIGALINDQRFQKNFSFIKQIQSASGSIMDNIAEGFDRGSRKDFINFLSYAKGSVGEVRSQLHRAFDLGYITQAEFNELYQLGNRIAKLLSNLIFYLKSTTLEGSTRKAVLIT